MLRFATQPAIMMTKLLGIKWELRGAKNLLKDEAAVIAMTHQSMLDILGKCFGINAVQNFSIYLLMYIITGSVGGA